MKRQEALDKMFLMLEMHNVFTTPTFAKDILNLVETDINKFIEKFSKDMIRNNLKDYKKYERLRLTSSQSKKLDGNSLFRYEYRNSTNLRCIYLIIDENTNKRTLLLNAFNEDENKTKGKNSYNFNIERAIKIYQSIKLKERGFRYDGYRL